MFRTSVINALALTALVLLSGCATLPQLQPPGVSLERIELLQLGFDQQRFGLELEVSNPNGVALPITGLRYGLTVSGIELGNGASTERMRIPANGNTRVQLELSVDAVRLLGQLSEWTRRPPSELSYLFDGEIDVELWPRPLQVSREGRVPLQIAPGAFRL